MGVEDFMPNTKPAHRRVNITINCRGMRIGVDSSVWLHELALRHAAAVVVHKDFTGLVKSFTARANHLVYRGITPVFVFDGAPAAAKGGTDAARAVRCAKAYAAYEQSIQDADPTPAHLRAAIRITWDIVTLVIDALRERGFAYFVAPFEADGQLAKLSHAGLVDGIFTIDTDLTVLGGGGAG